MLECSLRRPLDVCYKRHVGQLAILLVIHDLLMFYLPKLIFVQRFAIGTSKTKNAPKRVSIKALQKLGARVFPYYSGSSPLR